MISWEPTSLTPDNNYPVNSSLLPYKERTLQTCHSAISTLMTALESVIQTTDSSIQIDSRRNISIIIIDACPIVQHLSADSGQKRSRVDDLLGPNKNSRFHLQDTHHRHSDPQPMEYASFSKSPTVAPSDRIIKMSRSRKSQPMKDTRTFSSLPERIISDILNCGQFGMGIDWSSYALSDNLTAADAWIARNRQEWGVSTLVGVPQSQKTRSMLTKNALLIITTIHQNIQANLNQVRRALQTCTQLFEMAGRVEITPSDNWIHYAVAVSNTYFQSSILRFNQTIRFQSKVHVIELFENLSKMIRVCHHVADSDLHNNIIDIELQASLVVEAGVLLMEHTSNNSAQNYTSDQVSVIGNIWTWCSVRYILAAVEYMSHISSRVNIAAPVHGQIQHQQLRLGALVESLEARGMDFSDCV